jgi:hypothetical protein
LSHISLLKLKNIQKVIDKAITPKCQLKWEISYEKIFNWISIGIYWTRLNAYKALSSSNEMFEWSNSLKVGLQLFLPHN